MDDLMNNVNSLSHNRQNMHWIGLNVYEMQVLNMLLYKYCYFISNCHGVAWW